MDFAFKRRLRVVCSTDLGISGTAAVHCPLPHAGSPCSSRTVAAVSRSSRPKPGMERRRLLFHANTLSRTRRAQSDGRP